MADRALRDYRPVPARSDGVGIACTTGLSTSLTKGAPAETGAHTCTPTTAGAVLARIRASLHDNQTSHAAV